MADAEIRYLQEFSVLVKTWSVQEASNHQSSQPRGVSESNTTSENVQLVWHETTGFRQALSVISAFVLRAEETCLTRAFRPDSDIGGTKYERPDSKDTGRRLLDLDTRTTAANTLVTYRREEGHHDLCDKTGGGGPNRRGESVLWGLRSIKSLSCLTR